MGNGRDDTGNGKANLMGKFPKTCNLSITFNMETKTLSFSLDGQPAKELPERLPASVRLFALVCKTCKTIIVGHTKVGGAPTEMGAIGAKIDGIEDEVSPSPAVAPAPPAVPIEQLLKRITEIEKQMQEQKAAADKQTQQKDAAMAVLEKRVKGIEEELQAEKTARAEERAASEERQRVAMEIREHGESQACKKLVAELATMQEQLQKAKSALIKLQDLIASGLVPGVFVDETEKQVQTLEGEVARLTEELARQKKQDEVLTDSGAEALRQIKELKELLEKGGLQKPATRGLSSRAQAQNSNQDLVDIRFQSMPSWKDMPPENSLVACITDEVFHIRDFADTTKRFAEAFLAEAEMITEDRVKHGKVLEKFPKLTRETTKAVVVFTMELQMVDPRARDHDEFYRNLGIVIRVRDSAKMQKLHGYGHYLFRGLTALTPYEGTLWRGIAGRKQVILAIDNYSQEHMDIVWSSFSSGTPSREVAVTFAQKDTEDTEDPRPDVFPGVRGLLFRIETTNCARDVSPISAVSGEDERTILPNTTFVLIKLAHVGSDGLLEIHMKEKPEQNFKY